MEELNQAILYDKAFDAYTNEKYDEFESYLKEGLDPYFSNGIFMKLAFARDDSTLVKLLYDYNIKHPTLPEILTLFQQDSINVLKELIFNNYPIHDYHIKAVEAYDAPNCKALIKKIIHYQNDLSTEELIALIKDNFI